MTRTHAARTQTVLHMATLALREGKVARFDAKACATFYRSIVKGIVHNPTVAPSVRSNLATILGRTAADTGRIVTWAEMMKANETLPHDMTGLKA